MLNKFEIHDKIGARNTSKNYANIYEKSCFSWNLQNCDFCYTSAVKTCFFNIQVSQKYLKFNEQSMENQCLKKVVNIVTKLCQNDPK